MIGKPTFINCLFPMPRFYKPPIFQHFPAYRYTSYHTFAYRSYGLFISKPLRHSVTPHPIFCVAKHRGGVRKDGEVKTTEGLKTSTVTVTNRVSHSPLVSLHYTGERLKYTRTIHTNYRWTLISAYQERIKNTPGTERSVPRDFASRKCGFFVE